MFTGGKMMLAGLAEFMLPGRAVRLCDGGFCTFQGNSYVSYDPDFGSIQSVEIFATGVGDEAPAGRLVFLPSSTAAAALLSSPTYQDSKLTFWFAKIDEATGAVVESRIEFSGLLDVTRLRIGRGTRTLEMDFVSESERLFWRNKGNALSSRFHKLVNPGELGLDNATGVAVAVPWGTDAPQRMSGGAGVGGGGGAGRDFGGPNAFV